MKFYLRSLCVRMGYASTGGESLCKLERAFWEFFECSGVKDDSTMLNVVHLERKVV